MSTTLDKFLITAMDRFVWFILLIVTTHLVTEFTKTNGYTRGERRSIPLPINQSTFLNAIEIPLPYWIQNPNHNLDLMPANNEVNANKNEEKNTFSLRPFIDSIFEIPMSAMNAVNRFVQRLTSSLSMSPTGSYTNSSPTSGGYSEKSAMRQESS